jgi:hypothetical protein
VLFVFNFLEDGFMVGGDDTTTDELGRISFCEGFAFREAVRNKELL